MRSPGHQAIPAGTVAKVRVDSIAGLAGHPVTVSVSVQSTSDCCRTQNSDPSPVRLAPTLPTCDMHRAQHQASAR